MTPSMAKKIRSSTSTGFQVEPGALARRRASHQAPAKPSRYMIPYQCTCSGPTENATLLNPGNFSMERRSLADLASHAAEERLQVARLGNRGVYRVIGGLAARFEDLYEARAVARRALNGLRQLLRREVIRTGARHQQPFI